jgi:hypothetical protein
VPFLGIVNVSSPSDSPYLNVVHIRFPPFETDAVLIIDTDAVLSSPVTMEFFQSVAGWDLEVIQRSCTIQHGKLAPCHAGGWCTPSLARSPDFRRFFVGESLDHKTTITGIVNNVNR